jgi:hypothetical protein
MNRYFSIIIAASLLLSSAMSQAQDADSETKNSDATSNEWEFLIAPYGWLTALSSDVTIGETESTTDASIGDVLDILKFGGFLHMEAQKGKWGIFSDITYAKLGDSGRVKLKRGLLRPGIKIDADLQQTIVEVGALYEIGDEDANVDLLLGARYFKFDVEADVGPFNISRDKDWLDPFVGARGQFRLSDKWGLSTRADIGGFGAGSDLTINASAIFTRKITENTDFGIGYRYLDVDYDDDNIEYDTQMHGPLVGVGFRF